MKQYTVGVYLPISLCLEGIEAEDEYEALEKAKKEALKVPLEEWGDDFSQARAEVLDEEEIVCPYCGSSNVEHSDKSNNTNEFHCHDCDRLFDKDDCEFEDLRHRISALLDGTDKGHPKRCEIVLGENDPETCGLSTLELPVIDMMFLMPGDGTIWYHIKGYKYLDIDTLNTDDLRAIEKGLNESD